LLSNSPIEILDAQSNMRSTRQRQEQYTQLLSNASMH